MISLTPNRATLYALHSVAYLAQQDHSPILVREIAEANRFPHDSTLKVLRQLSRAGYVLAHRGITGGFSLRVAPGRISVLQVVEAVIGRLEADRDVIGAEGDLRVAEQLAILHQKLAANVRSVLGGQTISQLSELT